MLQLKIKVCGLKYAQNVAEVSALLPDYAGFIFYAKSSRFVGEDFDAATTKNMAPSIKKTGIFVNADFDYIAQKITTYDLQAVQLHGNETPALCRKLQTLQVEVIKAFAINEQFNFADVLPYKGRCNFFLFDAKGKQPGGNGIAYRPQLLEKYELDVPFFLSGGLGLHNIGESLRWQHPQRYAIDVNSCFETRAALKNIQKLEKLFKYVRYSS